MSREAVTMREVRESLVASRPRFDARPKFGGRLKRRPKRAPSNGFRRANSPQPPRAVEAFMVIAMKQVHKRFAAAMKEVFTKEAIERFARSAKDVRGDAGEEDEDDDEVDLEELQAELEEANEREAAAMADRAKRKAAGARDEKRIHPRLNEAAKRTHEHSKKEFERLGIDVRKEPTMTPLIDGWRKDSVARITNMQEDQISKIEGILADGYGRRAESIAADIERQIEDVSESRAELIARDQVLTLNAKITEFRQTAAGIEEYVWTTSGDERVREEHEELEGEVFSWDEGGDPEEGHPGEAVNCRCTAFPILPGDDEDLED